MSTVTALRSLVENGIAKRFDLVRWAAASACEAGPSARHRLEHLFAQARPDVLKLLVMESLVDTPLELAETSVYGETTLESFLEFLNAQCEGLARERGSSGDDGGDGEAAASGTGRGTLTFYDLGSGAGKSVMTAALSPYFGACHGIEMLPVVHAIAEALVEDFHSGVSPRDDGTRPEVSVRAGDIFVDTAWVDADVVFCNCVTWDEDTMARLALEAARMRPGSLFITVLVPLESDAFDVVAEDELDFSWGVVEAVVHRRKST